MEQKSKHLSVGTGLGLMIALAAVAFWGLGALATKRYSEPLDPGMAMTTTAGERPLQILRTGTQDTLEIAQEYFASNQPSKAVVALDAARRVARVGRDVGAPGFAGLLEQLKQSRKAVQNGSRAEAATMLDAASREFANSAPTGAEASERSGMPPGDATAYRGATVINAVGVRIGELESVDATDAVLALGNTRDVFGFWDVGGERTKVPLTQLIAGRKSGRGITTVVFPVAAARPERIKGELTANR